MQNLKQLVYNANLALGLAKDAIFVPVLHFLSEHVKIPVAVCVFPHRFYKNDTHYQETFPSLGACGVLRFVGSSTGYNDSSVVATQQFWCDGNCCPRQS